jgi:hypothetical protein
VTFRPVLVYKLTPAQISLIERLTASEDRAPLDELSYRETVAHQELQRLGFTDLRVAGRRKLWVTLTNEGVAIREAGYFSKKPVIRLTIPQINLLLFLAESDHTSVGRHSSEMPDMMRDVCRRMVLRGWVEWQEHAKGGYWARLTSPGREIVLMLGGAHQPH